MNIGMMWMDDSADKLPAKLQKGAHFYQNKYGVRPTTCFVPLAILPEPAEIAELRVIPNKTVIKYHFWFGVDDGEQPDTTVMVDAVGTEAHDLGEPLLIVLEEPEPVYDQRVPDEDPLPQVVEESDDDGALDRPCATCGHGEYAHPFDSECTVPGCACEDYTPKE